MNNSVVTSDPEFESALREIARPEPVRAPATIAHYAIEASIGKGGMGIVYRARDVRLDRHVALKLLPPELADDPTRRALLLREARAAAKIKHPNVTSVFDVGEDGSYIAMELVRGESLREVLARGALGEGRALVYAGPIAAGLAAAHAAGVVHRDLKPDNVVVDDDEGAVKICDFGLARIGAEDAVAGGTRRYIAPEQAASPRADVYAFGVLLHELVTGMAPKGDALDPRLKGATRSLVAACLARDPEERPADGTALAATLARAKARSRGGPWALTALGLLVAIVAVAWSVRRANATATIRSITTNSGEATVMAAALSPDGKHVAYAEKRGVFVAPVTGQARRITAGTASLVAWFPDGRSLLVDAGDELARLDLDSGRTSRLDVRTEGADAAAPSPDGRRVALARRDGLWIATLDGTPAGRSEVHVVGDAREHASLVGWSPSGRTLVWAPLTPRADGSVEVALELVDVASGRRHVVFEDPRLGQIVGEVGATFLNNDRLAFGLAATRDEPSVVAEIAFDPQTFVARGAPQTLASLDRWAVSHLTSAGSRMAGVRYATQTDVLVADFDPEARTLSPLQRVTLSDANERPSAFTDDGRVLVVADAPRGERGERTMLLDPKTGLGAPLSAGWTTFGAALPEGSFLAFGLEERGPRRAELSLVRVAPDGARLAVPLAGTITVRPTGRPPPHQTAIGCSDDGLRCFLLRGNAEGRLSIDRIDPQTLALDPVGAARDVVANWGAAVAHDGTKIALPHVTGHAYVVIRADGTPVGKLALPDHCQAQFAAFTRDDEELVATMICAGDEPYVLALVSLDSRAPHTLAKTSHAWLSHPVVGRDGRTIALSSMPFEGNAFVMDLSR